MVTEFAFVESFSLNPAYMVCVDFNGRAAYAYLCRNHRIQAKVWLYNALPAPDRIEWQATGPERAPYLNPKRYVREDDFILPRSREEIEIQWFLEDGKLQARIYIHDELHATMLCGEGVGRCRLARINSPLARRMSHIIP